MQGSLALHHKQNRDARFSRRLRIDLVYLLSRYIHAAIQSRFSSYWLSSHIIPRYMRSEFRASQGLVPAPHLTEIGRCISICVMPQHMQMLKHVPSHYAVRSPTYRPRNLNASSSQIFPSRLYRACKPRIPRSGSARRGIKMNQWRI